MNQPLPLIDTEEEPTSKLTTPELAAMLRIKYERTRYALFFDVPDAVSIKQKRRIDALAFGLWASEGQDIEGFELKVSRSDWLREVKQVDKADPFIALCDRFWLVTADNKIVKLDEIPACWGWLTATKAGLRVQRPALRLPGCGENLPRTFALGIMRKMQDDLTNSPDVAAVIEENRKQILARQKSEIEYATSRLRRERDEAVEAVKNFQDVSGIDLLNWRYGNVAEIVASLRELGGYNGGLNAVPKLLEGHENALRITLERVVQVREQLTARVANKSTEQQ